MRVFLLHGLGADRRAFQRFERLLPSDWDITALDLLGHGDAPKPAHGYRLDDHAEYIAGIIAQHIGAVWIDAEIADAPAVVGHSYGAAVGTALAAIHPSIVSKLVLMDPVVAPEVSDDSYPDIGAMGKPLSNSS